MSIPSCFLRPAGLLVAVLLSACVETSFDRYPSHWSPVADGGNCPDLSGVFAFRGDVGGHPELAGMATLDPFINYTSENYDAIRAASYVRINGPQAGRLLISYWNKDGRVHEMVLTEGGGFRCEGTFITIMRPGGTKGRLFTRARDGALLSHVRYIDGMVFVVPLSVRAGSYWQRWPSIQPNSSLQSNAP